MEALEKRERRARQKADLIRLSESYRRDLVALRVKWGIPSRGYKGDTPAQEWMGAWVRSGDAHTAHYSALLREAKRRGRSRAQIDRLVQWINRENPINKLWRGIRNLNRRYGLDEQFDNFFRLLWDSHLIDHVVSSGVSFCNEPPSIVITPDLRRRDLEEACKLGLVRMHQELHFGKIPNPKGGRPKRGESRTLVIGETGEGEPCILIHNLTLSLIRREWHKVKAVQQERWPDYKGEHYKPAHDRRKELVERGGLGIEMNVYDLIDELFGDEDLDGDTDRKRRATINQDRRRLRQQLEPTEE